MTKGESLQLVAILQAHYPTWKPTSETAKIWAECLVDLDYAVTNAALKRILMSQAREFPPPIATIREEAAKMVCPEIAISPEEAWSEVKREIQRVGWCGNPRWSHPAVAQAVDAMGWRELCSSPEGDTGTRAHFFRVYHAYQVRTRETCILPPAFRLALPGQKPAPSHAELMKPEEPKQLESPITEEQRQRNRKGFQSIADIMRGPKDGR